MKGGLAATDLDAVEDIAGLRTPGLTALAHAFSFLAGGYFVAPFTVLACLLMYRVGRRPFAVALGLGVVGSAALSTLDKILVDRPRPPLRHLEAVGSAGFSLWPRDLVRGPLRRLPRHPAAEPAAPRGRDHGDDRRRRSRHLCRALPRLSGSALSERRDGRRAARLGMVPHGRIRGASPRRERA